MHHYMMSTDCLIETKFKIIIYRQHEIVRCLSKRRMYDKIINFKHYKKKIFQ